MTSKLLGALREYFRRKRPKVYLIFRGERIELRHCAHFGFDSKDLNTQVVV